MGICSEIDSEYTTTLINKTAFEQAMTRTFHVIIEQDEDGGFIGKVSELQGCLSQGDSLDELMKNIKEAIELCLEVWAEKNFLRSLGKKREVVENF